MLTTYDRALREWRRKVRLEAALSYRESDRRVPGEEYTWTRHRDMEETMKHQVEPQIFCRRCLGWRDTSAITGGGGGGYSRYRTCVTCGLSQEIPPQSRKMLPGDDPQEPRRGDHEEESHDRA